MKGFRKLSALLLAGTLSLGCLWPSLVADASDFSIDDTGFKNPAIDHMTVYKWVEGVPGYSWSQTFGKKFPVLITWDDQYYLKITTSVASYMENNIGGFGSYSMLHGWSDNKKDSGYINGSFEADGQYPHGYFLQNAGYPGSSLSSLEGLDFSVADHNGSFITLSVPEGVPYIIPTWPGNYDNRISSGGDYDQMHKNIRYALEVDLPSSYQWYRPDYISKYYTDGGLRQGENFLVGMRCDYCKHWIDKKPWYQADVHNMSNGFYWSLFAINKGTYNTLVSTQQLIKEAQASYDDAKLALFQHEFNNHGFVDYFCWYVAERTENGKKYQCFWTPGSYIHDKDYYLCDILSDYDEVKDLTHRSAKISLAHYDGNFETRGNYDGDWVLDTFKGSRSDLWGANQKSFSFRCFYAKPLTMDFLQTDFTVEDGQVTNLDGPIAIANGTTITVKDGGTLSVSGWVMNNGTIKVEEGGTLYVQDNSCVNRYHDGGHYHGDIISNGLIIIGENAKLIGGGLNGIKLLDGSHVVNYGCLASEYFTITNDHTVENRDNGFVLSGSGNGVLNSGNITYETPLSGQTFAERGVVEENAVVSFADNAVYNS